MLKIVDEFNLEDLKKMGFVENEVDGGYLYHFKEFLPPFQYSFLWITDERLVIIKYVHAFDDYNSMELIYDMIKMNIIEKIEEVDDTYKECKSKRYL